ncbi:hypothetical protein AB595_04600 [Massilia sp. WF1]|uniref:SH3 domain-containing protein n=1 Tax=unclassified Massilia TaxID=2609279 RepID=UPI00064B2A9D|nr:MULTISPECIES: SH3 domain-containing protein [unclassified Massilia]ALK96957.1 hypothetical protein AM586_12500 [Massilia sp. WG5]KLU37910.1 hypothetical protein AB595_04600 [Massilia sp. WF1]
MSAPIHWATVAAYGIGLLLTLALAGLLTPRRWWRRPTAGNLAMVGGGTLAFGFLVASLLPAAAPAVASPQEQPLTPPLSLVRRMPAAAPRYRVIDSLNLRAAKATGAPRLAVLPAGTLVTPLGSLDGDWLRVRARLNGKEIEGWTSSLWLRRVDERAPGADD